MSFKVRNQKVPDVHDTITIASGSLTNTKTHTGKVFANCRLRLLSFKDNSDGSGSFPHIFLTQSGSDVVVNAARTGSFGSDIVVSYAIEEYVNHVIKSIQRFTMQVTGTSSPITQTVTQVGPYYSLDQLGVSTTDNVSGNMAQWCLIVSYDGVTTVTATPGPNGAAATIKTSLELVEWY
jgi:hypothetical protein